MLGIYEETDTDLKAIDPVRKFFSNGQIYLVGDGHRRRKGKKDGYLLRYRESFPIAVF